MKTIKVRFTLSIGLANARQEEVLDIEVGDQATDEQIREQLDEEWSYWSSNYIDGGAEVVE